MRVISGDAGGHNLKAPKGMTTRPMADKIKGAVFSMLDNFLSQLDREWGRVLDLYAGSGSIGIEALSRGAEWADFVEINAGVCRVISENLEHTKLSGQARVNNRNVHSFLNSPPPPPGPNHAKRAAGGLHRRKGGERSQPVETLVIAEQPQSESVNELEADNSLDDNTIHNERQYDIIFLDPPYADPKIPDTLEQVARSGLVKPGGLVVIGHSPRVSLKPAYNDAGAASATSGSPLHLLRHRRHGDSAFTIFLAGEPTSYGFDLAKASDNPIQVLEEDASAEWQQ